MFPRCLLAIKRRRCAVSMRKDRLSVPGLSLGTCRILTVCYSSLIALPSLLRLFSSFSPQIISPMLCLVTQLCLTLCDPMDCNLAGFSLHGDSPGKNIRVGCHDLPHGIFPTQGSNPGLPHCRQSLHHLSHQGSPRILEWVSPALLQGIFLTQESNWGLMYCRQSLYS